MSRSLTQFQKDRLKEFSIDIQSNWGGSAEICNTPNIVRIHKRYLAVACLASLLIQRKKQRNEYAKALPEVTFLTTVMATKGLESPAFVLLRQSIELCLKQIYFSTHPVEYAWSAHKDGYREISFQFLMENLKKTEELSNFPESELILTQLSNEFSESSRHVHVHSRKFIKFGIAAPSDLNLPEAIKNIANKCTETWALIISLIIMQFPQTYIKASNLEKQVIMEGVPSKYKQNLLLYLKELSLKT